MSVQLKQHVGINVTPCWGREPVETTNLHICIFESCALRIYKHVVQEDQKTANLECINPFLIYFQRINGAIYIVFTLADQRFYELKDENSLASEHMYILWEISISWNVNNKQKYTCTCCNQHLTFWNLLLYLAKFLLSGSR